MNTISFATTQMNLINCVEYVSSINGNHTLFVDSVSRTRKKQMKYLLQTPSYSNVFKKIYYRANSDKRLLDFVFTLVYHLELFFISRTKQFDEVVSGNYLCCGSRLLYMYIKKKYSNIKYIACDDGTGTIAVAKKREEEITTQKPMMYMPNCIIKVFVNRFSSFIIPKHITFFTNYDIKTNGLDIIIRNNYFFLKQHLCDFNVDLEVFDCEAVVLGEPLYFKKFVSAECYAEKLRHYAKTVEGRLIYYAHPEETKDRWDCLKGLDKYKYVDNVLPFEIIAAILPDRCRLATFISSVINNISLTEKPFSLECISFKADEIFKSFDYTAVLGIYEQYKQNGVKFYEFD